MGEQVDVDRLGPNPNNNSPESKQFLGGRLFDDLLKM